jgi:phosphatidylserine decarboxylase
MREERGAYEAVLAPMNPAGWPFVGGSLALAVVLGFVWQGFLWLGLILALWCAYFFRDPKRVSPIGPSLVLSPADGIVQRVTHRIPPVELELGQRPLPCVSVFLSVFDVHVNRTPVAGTIVRRSYRPGKFVNAAHDKASEDNERQSFAILTPGGQRVGLVQIAGLVARRIVKFVDEGDTLDPGDRVGLIRFGSRCDVYLPEGTAPVVLEGQRAVGGETVLADLEGPQIVPIGRES